MNNQGDGLPQPVALSNAEIQSIVDAYAPSQVRKAAIEECAALCDARALIWRKAERENIGQTDISACFNAVAFDFESLARSIRGLASQPQPPAQPPRVQQGADGDAGDADLIAAPHDTGKPDHADVRAKYDELLYAVARKHPGETRHETALRYIRQAETPSLTQGEQP